MAVEIPFEVAIPIKSADEPVVAELKRAPIAAIQPTGEKVHVAAVVIPPLARRGGVIRRLEERRQQAASQVRDVIVMSRRKRW